MGYHPQESHPRKPTKYHGAHTYVRGTPVLVPGMESSALAPAPSDTDAVSRPPFKLPFHTAMGCTSLKPLEFPWFLLMCWKSLFGEATFDQRYLMLESDSNPDSQQIGGSKHEDLQLCKRLWMQPSIMYWLSIALLSLLLACLLGSFDFVFIAFHFLVFPFHFCSFPYFVRQAIEAASKIELFGRYEAG